MQLSTPLPIRASLTGGGTPLNNGTTRSLCKKSPSHDRNNRLITTPPEMNDLVVYEFIDYGDGDVKTSVNDEVAFPKWSWSIGRVTRTLSSDGTFIADSGGVGQQHPNRFSKCNNVLDNSVPSGEFAQITDRTAQQSVVEIIPLHRIELGDYSVPIRLKTVPNVSDNYKGNVIIRNDDKGQSYDSLTASPVQRNLPSGGVEAESHHHCQLLEDNAPCNTTTSTEDVILSQDDNGGEKYRLEDGDCVYFSMSTNTSIPQLILSSAILAILDRDALLDSCLVDVQAAHMQAGFDSVYIPKVLLADILANASARCERANENEENANYSQLQLQHDTADVQNLKGVINKLRIVQQRFVDSQKAHLRMKALQRRTQEKAVSKLKLMMAHIKTLEGCINDISDMTNIAAMVEGDYMTRGGQYSLEHLEDDSAGSQESGTKYVSRVSMERLHQTVIERVEKAGIFINKQQGERERNTTVADPESYGFISQMSVPIMMSTSVQATQGNDTSDILHSHIMEKHTSHCNVINCEISMDENTPQNDSKKANDRKPGDNDLPLEIDSLLLNESTFLEIADHISTLEKQILEEKKRTSIADETLERLVMELTDVANSTEEKKCMYSCGSSGDLNEDSTCAVKGDQAEDNLGDTVESDVFKLRTVTQSATTLLASIRERLTYEAQQLRNTEMQRDAEKERAERTENLAKNEKAVMEQMIVDLKDEIQQKDRELERFVCLEPQLRAAGERIASLEGEVQEVKESQMNDEREHAYDLEMSVEILEAVIMEYEELIAKEKDRADVEIDFAARALQHAAFDIAELKESNSNLMVAFDDVIYFAESSDTQGIM